MRIAITTDMFYPTLNGVSVFSRNLATGLARKGQTVVVVAPSQTGEAYEEIDDGTNIQTVAPDEKTPKNHYRIYRLKSKPFAFYRNQTDENCNREKMSFRGILEDGESMSDDGREERPRNDISLDDEETIQWHQILINLRSKLPKIYTKGFMLSPAPNKEITEILDNFMPDVIHNQQELMIGLRALAYGHKRRVPIMTTNHVIPDNIIDNLNLPRVIQKTMIGAGNSIIKSYLGQFDYLTMPTNLALDMFYDKKRPKNLPMRAVSNGIDLQMFTNSAPDTETLAKYGFTKTDQIITFVGRFDIEKHIPILMQSFQSVAKNLPNAKLLLIGDGDELTNLQDFAKELEIDNKTVFVGRVSREELAKLHQLATVFVMPSPAELQSIATLEAMASGKPIVAVEAGALPELAQNGKNGFSIPVDDVEKMTGAILKILTNSKLRADFGKKSLEIAKQHELGKTIEQFEQIYRQLTKKTSPKNPIYHILAGVGVGVGAIVFVIGIAINKMKKK
jgi:glycosyltransferase involved in cell wall biosynthesis